MFFVYRKVSNIFLGNNHHQHDVMDQDHDHETPTGPIKVDNQTIFTQEFAKRPTQVYEAMVNVLKQLEDTKRVNETFEDEFNEREDHDRKKAFTPSSSTLQRTPKFPDSFISKPMDLRERTDRDTANSFVEKMAKINEVLKEQMAFF